MGIQPWEARNTEFTQAYSLGWHANAPWALIPLHWRHLLAFRRAIGPKHTSMGQRPMNRDQERIKEGVRSREEKEDARLPSSVVSPRVHGSMHTKPREARHRVARRGPINCDGRTFCYGEFVESLSW